MAWGGVANATFIVTLRAPHCAMMRLPHCADMRQRAAEISPAIRLPTVVILRAAMLLMYVMKVRRCGLRTMASGRCGRALPLGFIFLTLDTPVARCSILADLGRSTGPRLAARCATRWLWMPHP